MQILFIASYSGTSGANHSLVKLVSLLRNKFQINPLVILPRKGPIEKMLKNENINYLIITYYSWVTDNESLITKFKWQIQRSINYISDKKLSKLIEDKGIDMVYINALTSNQGARSALKNNIKLIWHIREFLDLDLRKNFRREKYAYSLINNSDSIIAISNSIKEHHSKKITKEKIYKIYNGIDHTLYKRTNNISFKEQPYILTIAGRIVYNKGHHDAIKAVSRLVKIGYNIKLQIVGNSGDTTYIEQIKGLIHNLYLQDNVEFLGYRTDIEYIWSNTDIGLICSKAEAFGRVTVEAMLGGAVIVGADTAGTKEIIMQSASGLLYDEGNYKDLSEKIKKVLDNPKIFYEKARQGKKFALENFSAEKNARDIYRIIKKMMKG